MFLFINVIEDGNIDNMPLNLTIHLHHNTTILDNLIIKSPDELSLKYGNVDNHPFWTGYALTLQKQIDEFYVKKYTGQ